MIIELFILIFYNLTVDSKNLLQYATVLAISMCEKSYYCVLGNNYVKVVDIVRTYHTDIQM